MICSLLPYGFVILKSENARSAFDKYSTPLVIRPEGFVVFDDFSKVAKKLPLLIFCTEHTDA